MVKWAGARAFLALCAMVAALALAACGSGDDDGGSASGDGGSETTQAGGGETELSGKRVGMALGGPKNDRGFYQSAYDGLMAAVERDGLEETVVDSLEDPQQRFETMKNLASDNELVIGGGAEFIDSARTLSGQFPDVEFVVLTGIAPRGIANLHAYVPRQGVPAYIAGAVAATLSRTSHVGFVGGAEIPPTEASNAAFEQGAQDTKTGTRYSTTTVGTFNDPATAKQAAAAQLAAGADSLFAFLDAGTPGVVQAIDESGKSDGTLFAAIAPRCEESPRFVGTTILDVGRVVEVMVEDWEAGRLPDGTRFYGVETPDIQRFELCPEFDTPELRRLVEGLTERLNAEEIRLPANV